MSAEKQLFIYEPLDRFKASIRVCRLFPGTEEDAVQCELYQVLLPPQRPLSEGPPYEVPPYEALSYEWGVPPNTCQITLNSTSLLVRPNLLAALKALRSTTDPRTLWIDALCINQNDVAEKNAQVAMMGKIYRAAKKVLVWLGDAAHNSDLVFQDIHGLLPSYQQEELDLAYRHLSERSYWSRAWIRQEIILARVVEFHCGNQAARWIKFWYTLHERPAATGGHMWDLRRHRGLHIPPGAGSEWLYGTLNTFGGVSRRWECSDIRDRVYSVLSLVNDHEATEIVDYSVDACTIYLGLLGFDIERRGSSLHSNDTAGFAEVLRGTFELSPATIASKWNELLKESISSQLDEAPIRSTAKRLVTRYTGGEAKNERFVSEHGHAFSMEFLFGREHLEFSISDDGTVKAQ